MIEIVVPPSRFSSGKPKISTSVANQYLSHVSKFLLDNLFISKRDVFRSDRARDILHGFLRLHPNCTIPLRLRCKISITYPILLVIIKYIHDNFCSPLQLPLRRALCAAFSLGYALSLRPQEYLPVSTQVPLWKQANSSLAFFWFSQSDIPYSICCPEAFPSNQSPSDFTLFLDFNKNHQLGDGGPRSLSAAPVGAPFCCLTSIFEFFVNHPPAPGSALLSSISQEFNFSISLIREVLRAVASSLNLDPSRLVPHALRAAAVAQMLASGGFSDVDFLVQGRWSSLSGLRPYAHSSLLHSRRVSLSLYQEPVPLSWSRLAYSASSIS